MNLSRRSFLGGALALSVVAAARPALALALAATPVIYGDGVRDDWAGLQALFDGTPFTVDGGTEAFVAHGGRLTHGEFAVSRTLRVRRPNIHLSNLSLTALPGFKGETLFYFGKSATGVNMSDCYFDARVLGSEGFIEYAA